MSVLLTGTHTVAFNPINGWDTPVSQTVTVAANLTTSATGTYIQQTGSLQVALAPAGVLSDWAKWAVDGGDWLSGGATAANLLTGTHTVTFSMVEGWTTPGTQTLTVTGNLLTSATGTYAKSGTSGYYHDFTNQILLWDLTGIYQGDVTPGINLEFTISELPSGKLNGTGTLNLTATNGNLLSGSGTTTVNGTVKSSGSATTLVTMTATVKSGTGSAMVSGTTRRFPIAGTITVNGEINPADGELMVKSGSVSLRETGRIKGKKVNEIYKFKSGGTLMLPEDVTGAWDVMLDLTPKRNTYSGTATVQTQPDKTTVLTATGSTAGRTKLTTLTIKGGGASVTMIVKVSGSNGMDVQSVKGKLFGQSLKY